MSPVNVSAIGAYIREQREQAKISLRQLAQSAGISNPYLSQIERGLRRPSADILQQIARGLRISAEALYVQAGFLEDRSPGSVVREAVLTDRELTERQKQMLIEIYDSFRKETAMTRAEAAELSDDQPSLGADAAELSWPEDLSPAALGAAPRRLAIALDGEPEDEPERPAGGTVHPFPPPDQTR
jgi:transcriptional regulator with XRE-family HTH domain